MTSIADTQARIAGDFAQYEDWQDRYREIIRLGRDLPEFPEAQRTDANKVRGCQSQVWLHAELDDDQMTLRADSDAHIVRGLLALVLRVYSGHTPDAILAEPPTFVDQLGLGSNLSQTRAMGLQAVLKQVKMYAMAFKTLLDRQNRA